MISPLTPATFMNPLDATASTVASPYTSGATSLTVASGAAFPSPYPIRLTCFRGNDPTMLGSYARTHLKVTAVSGNVLTVAPLDGYSGLSLLVGDYVAVTSSKGTLNDIQTAIAADETTINQVVTVANGFAGGSTGQVLTKTSGTDFATAWQTPSGGGGGVSGSGTSGDLAKWTGSGALGNAVANTDYLPVASPTCTGPLTAPVRVATPHADTDGSTITLDFSASDFHSVTLAGNRTLVFSNAAPGQVVRIELIQDSTGGRTITWPTVRWPSATAPTLATAATKADLIVIAVRGDGTYAGAISISNY